MVTERASFIDGNGDEHLVILVETGCVDPYEVWLLNGEVIPIVQEVILYTKKYEKVIVNGQTFFREKNIMDYYGIFNPKQ